MRLCNRYPRPVARHPKHHLQAAMEGLRAELAYIASMAHEGLLSAEEALTLKSRALQNVASTRS